jgi:hypothetical protein
LRWWSYAPVSSLLSLSCESLPVAFARLEPLEGVEAKCRLEGCNEVAAYGRYFCSEAHERDGNSDAAAASPDDLFDLATGARTSTREGETAELGGRQRDTEMSHHSFSRSSEAPRTASCWGCE